MFNLLSTCSFGDGPDLKLFPAYLLLVMKDNVSSLRHPADCTRICSV